MDNNEYNEPVVPEDLGDGLYRMGGDIFCLYPIVSAAVTDTSVTFDYGTYTVSITWENSEGKRINPHWRRTYS